MSYKLEIDNGGNAFPTEGGSDSGLYPDPGMSLRDYFAGQFISNMDFRGETPARAAEWSYAVADAMIVARKEGA